MFNYHAILELILGYTCIVLFCPFLVFFSSLYGGICVYNAIMHYTGFFSGWWLCVCVGGGTSKPRSTGSPVTWQTSWHETLWFYSFMCALLWGIMVGIKPIAGSVQVPWLHLKVPNVVHADFSTYAAPDCNNDSGAKRCICLNRFNPVPSLTVSLYPAMLQKSLIAHRLFNHQATENSLH